MRGLVGIAALAIVAGAAQAYTLKQRSYRAYDGSVAFACVTAPFEGTIAFVPSERFPTGIAAIVVPASNYWAFLRGRYPTPWYEAAVNDIAGGIYTPAVRQFERETRKEATVMFQAEGDEYGNYDRPHLPLDAATLERVQDRVTSAISNCRLRRDR